MISRIFNVSGMVLGGMLLLAQAAVALPVISELLLLADVSGSSNDNDFNLQRDWYPAAFRSNAVLDAISANGDIAASLVYRSDDQAIAVGSTHVNDAASAEAVGWTHVNDAATAETFVSTIETAPRTSSGSTHLGGAMDFRATLFDATHVQAARDNAVAMGVDKINALWIEDHPWFGNDPGDYIEPVAYGEHNVNYGDGSFAMIVDSFDDFSDAIVEKIVREITPIPEPATMLLLGSGLIGLARFRRKTKK